MPSPSTSRSGPLVPVLLPSTTQVTGKSMPGHFVDGLAGQLQVLPGFHLLLEHVDAEADHQHAVFDRHRLARIEQAGQIDLIVSWQGLDDAASFAGSCMRIDPALARGRVSVVAAAGGCALGRAVLKLGLAVGTLTRRVSKRAVADDRRGGRGRWRSELGRHSGRCGGRVAVGEVSAAAAWRVGSRLGCPAGSGVCGGPACGGSARRWGRLGNRRMALAFLAAPPLRPGPARAAGRAASRCALRWRRC